MNSSESTIQKATALREELKFAKAIELMEKLLEVEPRNAKALHELALNLHSAGSLEKAIVAFKQLLEVQPDDPMVLNNIGVALLDSHRPEEAREYFAKVNDLMPGLARVNLNLAVAFMDEGNLQEAVRCCEESIKAEPANASYYSNLATNFERAGMTKQAIEVVRRGKESAPFDLQLHSMGCMLQCYEGIESEDQIAQNHMAFGRTIEASLQPKWTEFPNSRHPDRKLRIGFVSADFRRHVVACFMLGLIENLDRDEFDVSCYLVNRPFDRWSEEFERASDRFVDANGLSPRQLAEKIRSDKIDVLVDLAGHTASNVTPMFAARPAPVGVAYLGYPVTTGMTRIAYRIVDWTTDPPGFEALGSETLIRMEGSYMSFSTVVPIPPVPKRPNRDVIFGSFSNLNKIHDPTFSLWAKVLLAVPESKFLYLSKSLLYKEARERFCTGLERHGVTEDRLILKQGIQSDSDFLAAYAEMDICLDTFPYTGATTTVESALMGVPTVTLSGAAHRSRVSATILTAIGHPELVASNPEEYVQIAVGLAADKERLSGLQLGLRSDVERSPFMDYEDHAERFGEAIRECWRRWCANPV